MPSVPIAVELRIGARGGQPDRDEERHKRGEEEVHGDLEGERPGADERGEPDRARHGVAPYVRGEKAIGDA